VLYPVAFLNAVTDFLSIFFFIVKNYYNAAVIVPRPNFGRK
jgi:hypothetical protein